MKYLIILFLFVTQFLQVTEPDWLTQASKFVDGWKLARVISYDHPLD